MLLRDRDNRGFTLIEIMLVVAIISILAAIAIPNFSNYQLNAKTAEAKTNIGAIKTLQIAFKTEWDAFIPCAATLANPNPSKQPWPLNPPGFVHIGFIPAGNIYYNYQVDILGGAVIPNIASSGLNGLPNSFCVSANGDLNGDGIVARNGEYGYAQDITILSSTSAISGIVSRNGITQNLNPGHF